MARVFIVHGYTGYPDKNWFPWLKKELEKLGLDVFVPAMPNSDKPTLDEWLPFLQQTVSNADEETFLVGHSLGCPTILRYLESIPAEQKIGGVVLVAGFAEPLSHLPELDSFTTGAWNDTKIRESTNKITIIQSDDDPAVPFKMGENVRDRFGAKLVTVHNAGHVNENSGFTKVPFVLEEVVAQLK